MNPLVDRFKLGLYDVHDMYGLYSFGGDSLAHIPMAAFSDRIRYNREMRQNYLYVLNNLNEVVLGNTGDIINHICNLEYWYYST